MAEDDIKVCVTCGIVYDDPSLFFVPSTKTPDGFASACKVCNFIEKLQREINEALIMSENVVYKAFAGVVMFNPKEETTKSGNNIRRILVKLVNSATDTQLGVTLWDNFEDVEVASGDFVVIEGKYEMVEKESKVYHNMSCSSIVVFPMATSKTNPNQAAKSTPKVANPVKARVEF